jgi:hypothetical protein
MEPVPSGDQPAFRAWNTVGGRWQRSQIASAALRGAIVDLADDGGRARRHAGGGARTRTEPTSTVGPSRHGRTGRTRADPEAVTTVHTDRTGRAAGGTSSRRLSGGPMLVTTAVDPLRRPTSDPQSQLTAGAGCSLRWAPDDRSARSGRCPGDELTWCWRPVRSGVPTVGLLGDRPVGLPDRRQHYLPCPADRDPTRPRPERVNAGAVSR